MFTALALAATLQVASIPPALPQDPGPERRAAAVDLFSTDPNTSEYGWAIAIAASRLSGEVLTERGANLYDRDFRLSERLLTRAKASSSEIIAAAIRCVAEPMAQRLYVPDLVALKAYAASADGRNFWSFYIVNQPWQACFNKPVRDYLAPYVDEDLAAVIAETPLR